jgi:methionine-rich copper-binding protein CopC
MASFKVSRGLSLKRLAGAGMLALVMSVGLPSGTALAHAMLVKAEPARRAALTRAPSQVRLWFNEGIEKDYASLAVQDAAKATVTEIKPHVAADDPKSIVLPLPELEAGKYTVKFRVLSVDGHVVDSSYDFTVKSKAPQK